MDQTATATASTVPLKRPAAPPVGGKVICKIKEVKRPYSERFIGWRLQAAIPNDSGGAWAKKDKLGNPVSFHRRFLVAESSDYSELPTKAQVNRFLNKLRKWRKFTVFEWLE